MRRYKLTTTIEYYFNEEDLKEEGMNRIIKERTREIIKILEATEKSGNKVFEIVKAHLAKLPF